MMKILRFALCGVPLVSALVLFPALCRVPAPAVAQAAGFVFGSGAQEKPAPQVELFITSWCPYCKKAIRFFQSRGIAVKVYDIERDKSAAQRKQQLDPARGVPFALINGYKVHGYSEGAYQRALDGR